MFEHRLAALLGLTLGQLGFLSAHEMDRWRRYWDEENWGPRRYNMHAAMMVTSLINVQRAEGVQPLFWEDFMFRHPDDVAADQAKLVAAQAEILEHQERRKARRKARGKKP